MAELKGDFRSKIYSAIENYDAKVLIKLLTEAKSLKAKDELEMIKKAISSTNAFTHILYKGKSFPTIKSLAEALSIPPELLRQRIKNNWPQERWAEPVKPSNISYMGKEYKSYIDLARYLDIKPALLRSRIKKGLPEEEWAEPAKPYNISYMGKEYKSYIELADKLKLPKATLYKRIRDKWPSERWNESTLKNNRESRIVERYQQGDSIKKLAISFGLKMKVIEELLDRNGVLKEDDKKETESKKQLNIRLDSNYQKKISDIRNYWNKKGVFQFSEKQLTDLNALNSETTLSKFILETALDNLYLELQNELSIDNNIEKICQLRIEDKNLNSLWKKVKLKHYDNGVFKNFVSNEIESYQNKIEQLGKKLIGLNSRKDNVDENLILQEKLWEIAIKKSYLIPDKNDEETSKESVQIKLMELLKNKYPDI